MPFLCCAVQAAAAVDVAPPDGIVDIMEAVVAPKVRLSVETHCYHAVAPRTGLVSPLFDRSPHMVFFAV